jgi:hypothetical protein
MECDDPTMMIGMGEKSKRRKQEREDGINACAEQKNKNKEYSEKYEICQQKTTHKNQNDPTPSYHLPTLANIQR